MSATAAAAAATGPNPGRTSTRDPRKSTSGAKSHSDIHRNEQPARKHASSNNMNQEQLRIASLMNEKSDSGEIATKVEKVIELTKASKDAAVVALHDCDYDLNRAVSKILEGDSDDNWTSVSKKGKSEKEKLPVKGQVSESSAKQSNGMTGRAGAGTTAAAAVGKKNRTSAQANRKSGERPQRNSRSKEENSHPHDSAVVDRDNKQSDSRPRGPRTTRPPREGPNRPDRVTGERRPDAGSRRINGPSTSNRPRGPRTFLNQQKPVPTLSSAPDDFPNSIDTWSNTTADPDARPTPAPITSMTVGNWSDVVSGANEDWSEEDYDSNLMETKVFVPSGKPLPEKDNPPSHSVQQKQQQQQQQQQVSGPQIDRKEAAGAQILLSLKHPVSQNSGYNQISQSFINKQAAESIKSLVGIPTAPYQATASSTQIDHKNAAAAVSGRPAVNQSRRPTRIPESAVEMPSNDSVASLGVQFGALDVNFAPPDTQSFGKSDVQSMNHKTVISANSASSFEQQAKSVLAEDMIKRRDVLSNKPEHVIDPRNAVAKHVKSTIDSVKGSDLYSVPGPQPDYKGSVAYGGSGSGSSGGSYSAYSGISSAGGQFSNVYSNPSTYASTSSYHNAYPSSNAAKNVSSNLKDVETSSMGQPHHHLQQSQQQQKHGSYDLQSSSGLINSTQTTNVLKNSLSATGKGSVSNANIPRMMTQMMHPPYIMGSMASPAAFYAPVYDASMQMPPNAAQEAGGYAAAAYSQPPDSSKFTRSDGVSDGTTGASSGVSSGQAPVVSQHSQPFTLSTLPPGYGLYYMPPVPGMFQPQAGPFAPLPVPPVSSSHVSSAPGFPKGNYTSHSYSGSGYDATGLPLQPEYGKTQNYGQNPNQHQNKQSMPSTDLMGQSSAYSKSHGVQKTYDKINYPNVGQVASATAAYNLTGTQQQALGASAYNSYIVPSNMGQGFVDSAASQSGVGRSLPAGSKGPTSSAPKGYGQMYNPSW